MRLAIALLALSTIDHSWLDDDEDRVLALRARLEHIARQTGPSDLRPTVMVEHKTYYGTSFECVISDLEGRRVWRSVGESPKEAAREAFAIYWKDFQ